MIKQARTAVKFFIYGLVAGLMFAPRSGAETRKQLMDWLTQSIQGVTGSLQGGQQGGQGGQQQ